MRAALSCAAVGVGGTLRAREGGQAKPPARARERERMSECARGLGVAGQKRGRMDAERERGTREGREGGRIQLPPAVRGRGVVVGHERGGKGVEVGRRVVEVEVEAAGGCSSGGDRGRKRKRVGGQARTPSPAHTFRQSSKQRRF